jgi:hypothetical protein
MFFFTVQFRAFDENGWKNGAGGLIRFFVREESDFELIFFQEL